MSAAAGIDPRRANLRVFVSSTSEDLTAHRDRLAHGIELLRLGAERMEAFGASPEDPYDVYMRRVDGCDALVVVVAYRYGWVPTREEGGDGERSITWHEVSRALGAGKPVFAFLADKGVEWVGPRDAGEEAKERLRRFKDFLSSNVTRATFRSPDDLAVTVTASVANWLLDNLGRASDSLSLWVGRPASIGNDFVGRDGALEELDRLLADHGRVVVSGAPGTGKSRLVAEYAQRQNAAGFWSTAGATAEQTLAALAPRLGVGQGSETDAELAQLVESALRQLPARTLWIVDNVPTLDQGPALRNRSGSVRLLATSRDDRQHLMAGFGVFALRSLELEPAVELLRSRGYVGDERQELDAIAEAVGGLPFALEALAMQLGGQARDGSAERLLRRLTRPHTVSEIDAFSGAAGFGVERAEGVFAALTGSLNRLSA